MLNNKRNKYKTLSDEALLRSYKEKPSLEIIGEYYQRYGHLVMGTSMKYLKNKFDAEDLVMHLFEKLPSKLHDNSINRFKPWLYMVTKNECLMLLRKKGIKTLELIREPKQTNELELKIEKETQLLILENALEELKEEQKNCIKLFYIENKSYQEITDLTQLDLKKVKSAIQNGKRNLKINLEHNNEFKSIQ
jgi:RNA polymerase sigma-70 factor (ECF subfamily)